MIPIPGTQGRGYLGPARVLGQAEEGRVRILIEGPEGRREASAAPAAARALHWGQSVLVAGDGEGTFYVIGVLDSPKGPDRVEVADGARAEREGQRLRFYSREGQVLFEYDGATGKSRAVAPEGDLEIQSLKGRLDLVSEKGIRLRSREAIEMASLEGITMASASKPGGPASFLAIGPEETRLKAARFNVVAERIETLACVVKEKAKNIYRAVEQLCQLKTRRMRTLVEETCQIRSKNAYLKAEEDFKVRGDRIHLG